MPESATVAVPVGRGASDQRRVASGPSSSGAVRTCRRAGRCAWACSPRRSVRHWSMRWWPRRERRSGGCGCCRRVRWCTSCSRCACSAARMRPLRRATGRWLRSLTNGLRQLPNALGSVQSGAEPGPAAAGRRTAAVAVRPAARPAGDAGHPGSVRLRPAAGGLGQHRDRCPGHRGQRRGVRPRRRRRTSAAAAADPARVRHARPARRGLRGLRPGQRARSGPTDDRPAGPGHAAAGRPELPRL